MDYNDFLSELTRQPARAALSPDDLETMGKRASVLFLDRGMPLNEAIIKLAKECAGISQEQINRVVEFANRATFQASFDKQAGDKNVEFPIADSSEIIRHLNDSARGPVVKLAAQEYFRPPVRSVRESLEIDNRVDALFKMASFENMSQQELNDPSAFAQELPATEQALSQGMDFATTALAMGRETGTLEGFQKALDTVKSISKALESPEMPQPPQGIDPTGMPAPTDTTPMKMAYFQDGYMGGPADMLPYDATAMSTMPPMDPIQAMQPLMGYQGPPQMAMDQSLLMGTPIQPMPLPGMGGMTGNYDQFPKMSSDAAEAQARDEQIKAASARRAKYNIEKIAEELSEARDQNRYLIGEAEAELNKLAFQHVFDGGSLGELAHCLQVMGDGAQGVFDHLIPKLASSFYDLPKMQADMVRYEMEKGASVRAINPENPIVKLATGLTKMRSVQAELEKKAAEAKVIYNEALKAIGTREMTRVFE